MARLILSGIDDTSGQLTVSGAGDTLVDKDGNLVLAGGVELLSTTTGIDGTAIGTTNLLTVPSISQIVITDVVVRVTDIDTLTVVPDLGIGVAAGEDDIVPSQSLTGLSAVGDTFSLDVGGKSVTADASDIIKVGIDTGATATTLTLAIDLIGYVIGGSSIAERDTFVGALIYQNSTTNTIANDLAFDTLVWDATSFDTNSFVDLANERFIIPPSFDGYYFKFGVQVEFANDVANSAKLAVEHFNSGDVSQGVITTNTFGYGVALGSGTPVLAMSTRPVQVAAGDYFVALGAQGSVGNRATVTGLDSTHFWIQKIGSPAGNPTLAGFRIGFGGIASASDTTYLKPNGSNAANVHSTIDYRSEAEVPFNTTIRAVSWAQANASALQILVNGSVQHTENPTSAGTGSNATLNIAVSAGDTITINILGSTGGDWGSGTVHIWMF